MSTLERIAEVESILKDELRKAEDKHKAKSEAGLNWLAYKKDEL